MYVTVLRDLLRSSVTTSVPSVVCSCCFRSPLAISVVCIFNEDEGHRAFVGSHAESGGHSPHVTPVHVFRPPLSRAQTTMWHRWLLLLLLVPLVVPLDLSHSPFFMGMPTPGEFTAAQSAMLREARGCLGALTDLSLPDARNATLTLALYDCIVRWRGNVARQGQLLAAVHPMPEYRAAAEAAATEASRMADELSVNRAVYERLQAMDTSAEDAVTRYYAATLLRDFRLHGVDADEATRAKLTLMQAEIHNVTQVVPTRPRPPL